MSPRAHPRTSHQSPPVTGDEPQGCPLPDARLAAAAAGGDSAALGELYERHADAVWAHAMHRCASAAAADDVCGETWLQVVRSIAGFDPARGAFAGWVQTIAARKAVDAHRRAARAPVPVEIDPEQVEVGMGDVVRAGPVDPTGEAGVAGVVREELVAGLGGLGGRVREVVVATVVDGVDDVQAAAELGVGVGAVRVARHRGMIHLRAERVTQGSGVRGDGPQGHTDA